MIACVCTFRRTIETPTTLDGGPVETGVAICKDDAADVRTIVDSKGEAVVHIFSYKLLYHKGSFEVEAR